MEFLADLHVHSSYSDGKLSIPEIVDFYGSRGFGAIAVTDHICEDRTFLGVAASYLNLSLTSSTFPSYLAELEDEASRAWRKYRMVLIPGFELSKNSWFNHRSAHVLGLGIHEFVDADGDILDLAHAIREQGGLSIAAHPVSTGKFEPQTYHLWSRRKEFADVFDAWEVASGPKLFHQILESGLPIVASSDFHHPGHIEAWKTVFDCERHPGAIFEAIREQKLRIRFYQEPANTFAPLPMTVP